MVVVQAIRELSVVVREEVSVQCAFVSEVAAVLEHAVAVDELGLMYV